MTSINIHKYPRLFVEQELGAGKDVILSSTHAHYLKNVLRQSEGMKLRLFNGKNGEWLADIRALGKKEGMAAPVEQLRPQPPAPHKKALYFCPIKKHRMDFLIEKAVELGATDLHPIVSDRTEIRKINKERLQAQIIEAAEQCERLTLPKLYPLTPLSEVIQKREPLYACLERLAADTPPLNRMELSPDRAFLIGPVGGFTPEETEMLSNATHITPVSLGDHILRAETAAIMCLCL